MRSRYRRGLLDGVARERARELRANQTAAEKRLWSRLRRKNVHSANFRRQHPLYGFIVDFCCIEYRLVIELDGDSHADKAGYDSWRTEMLVKRGFRVLRILNDEVRDELDAVMERIWTEIQAPPP